MALNTVNRRAGVRAVTRCWLHPEPARLAWHTAADSRVDSRSLHSKVDPPKVPAPTPFVPDVTTLFTLIGRDMSQHADKLSSWDQLFRLTSPKARKIGIEPARSRRYLLNWLRRFRKGEYGLGGDAKFVDPEGNIPLRFVEMQLSNEEAERLGAGVARGSLTASPNTTRRVLNVPYVEPRQDAVTEPKQDPESETQQEQGAAAVETGAEDTNAAEASPEAQDQRLTKDKTPTQLPPLSSDMLRQAVPIEFVRYKPGRGITGPHVRAVANTRGQMAIIPPKAGLWESRRGEKKDGGERRRAEVRFKRRRAAQ